MLNQELTRDDDSTKSHRALVVRTFAPVGARFLASAEIKKSLAKTDFSLAGDSSEQVIFRMIFLG
jgi:hypothetical protein